MRPPVLQTGAAGNLCPRRSRRRDPDRTPKNRPVTVSDLHASICHAPGINPNKEVMTPLQRPIKLVDNGKPVAELFS
ncbi:DUF1501 domain-containing protein [Fimbriiglobus ruber]|uniref:DUF1501 domain-containing protein n=1 Tax=Fimbriiglobus ruber TaxID=1908690 RepID=UPI000B4BA6FD|nr:DUF1501 domain-containing protein [Fimbriiglobus ruber]